MSNGTVPTVRDDPAAGPRLADLGEAGFLARMLPLLPAGESALLGPGDDAGREEEVEVGAIVLLELTPSDLRRRHGCRWFAGGSLGC